MSTNDATAILKSLRILYIEDEASIRQSITRVLNYFSPHVLALEDAKSAQLHFHEFKADIIICDINLPGLSGIEFVKWVRGFDESVQIFLLTAYTDKAYLLDAIKLNLVDYLTKPIDFEILERTLKEAALKRVKSSNLEAVFINGAHYCLQTKTVHLQAKEYILTAKEATFLDYLLANPARTISKEELKLHVWQEELTSESAFKSLVNKLRAKVGKEAIENLSGIGYRVVLQNKKA